MKLDITTLKILDAIERLGSITKAAAQMGKVPSALSHAVAKSDLQLNTKLLERQGRGVVLTPIGMMLLEDGRKVLHALDQLEQKINRIEHGMEDTLVIGIDSTMPSSATLRLMAKFFEVEHKTELSLVKKNSTDLWEALRNRQIQLILGVTQERVGPQGNIVTRLLASTSMSLMVGAHHPAAKKIGGAPLELEQYPWDELTWIITPDEDMMSYPFELQKYMGKTLIVPTRQAQLEALNLGLGIAYLPENWTKEPVAKGQIKAFHQSTSWKISYYAGWNTATIGRGLRWFIKQFDNIYQRTSLVYPEPTNHGE